MSKRIDEIRARLAAATPGLWREATWHGPIEWPSGYQQSIMAHGPLYKWEDSALAIRDAKFIAAAPTDIAALLEAYAVMRFTLEDSGEYPDILAIVDKIMEEQK